MKTTAGWVAMFCHNTCDKSHVHKLTCFYIHKSVHPEYYPTRNMDAHQAFLTQSHLSLSCTTPNK